MQGAKDDLFASRRITRYLKRLAYALRRAYQVISSPVKRVFWFYVNGFRSMTLGRTLWLIILIKLFIMFAILKIFFFPNFLSQQGDSKAEKAAYVQEQLIERGQE